MPSNRDGTQVRLRQKRSSSGTTKPAGTLGFRLAIAPGSMVADRCAGPRPPKQRSKARLPRLDAALKELVGGMEPTVRTGSGGSHFYFVDGRAIVCRRSTPRSSGNRKTRSSGRRWNGKGSGVEDRASCAAGHACTLPPINPSRDRQAVRMGQWRTQPYRTAPDTLLKACGSCRGDEEAAIRLRADGRNASRLTPNSSPCRRSIPLCFPKRCDHGSWTRRSACLVRPISSPRPLS